MEKKEKKEEEEEEKEECLTNWHSNDLRGQASWSIMLVLQECLELTQINF